jgi:hypothetical protein
MSVWTHPAGRRGTVSLGFVERMTEKMVLTMHAESKDPIALVLLVNLPDQEVGSSFGGTIGREMTARRKVWGHSVRAQRGRGVDELRVVRLLVQAEESLDEDERPNGVRMRVVEELRGFDGGG